MSDIATRAAERAALDGDAEARKALTQERLRTQTGQVVFWRGSAKPFDCAVTARVEARTGGIAQEGWALAVLGLDDLFRIQSLGRANMRSGTVVDLPTGDVLQVFGGKPAALDAGPGGDEPGAGNADPPVEVGRGWRIRPVPPPKPVTSPWMVFDREGLPERWHTPITFFQNARAFTFHYEPKTTSDCNLLGCGGCLPAGHHFTATGISLLADESCPERVVDEIRDSALARFVTGPYIPRGVWPASFVLAEPARREPGSETIRVSLPPEILHFDEPIEIAQTQHFAVELVPGREVVVGDLWQRARILCVLHGAMRHPAPA